MSMLTCIPLAAFWNPVGKLGSLKCKSKDLGNLQLEFQGNAGSGVLEGDLQLKILQ